MALDDNATDAIGVARLVRRSMSLFDTYRPLPLLKCPRCESQLREWQGKDGPYLLFVWEQGTKHPVAQDGDDDDFRSPSEERVRFVLPAEFEIYSYDCPRHQPVEARCQTTSDVWVRTEVSNPRAK
jgi:hypothetical protein